MAALVRESELKAICHLYFKVLQLGNVSKVALGYKKGFHYFLPDMKE